MFEEAIGKLLCGEIFTQVGKGPALTSDDVVEAAMAAEAMFRQTCLAPHTAAALRGVGDLAADDAGDRAWPVVPGRQPPGAVRAAAGYEKLVVDA